MSEASKSQLVALGGILGIVNFVYLFLAQSGSTQWNMIVFYLLMIDASILSSFLIFGNSIAEKLHLSKENTMGIGVSVLIGIVIAFGLILIENLFMGANYQTEIKYDIGTGISTILYTLMIMFLVSIGEEIATRGFLNSIAENFSKSDSEKMVLKYLAIPLIFSLIHFFVWASSPVLMFGAFALIFMIIFHFTFGVAMQLLLDYTGSLWACIVAHMIYNSLKTILPILVSFNI